MHSQCVQFFPVPMFRNVTLHCLTEMASIKMETAQYDDQLLRLFTNTMQQLKQMLPLNTDMNAAYRCVCVSTRKSMLHTVCLRDLTRSVLVYFWKKNMIGVTV